MTTDSHHDDLRLLRTNLQWVSRQLALAGEPFIGLEEALAIADQESADLAAISAVLADHVIMSVELDRSGFARSTESKKRIETVTGGWSHYLVEILNPTSATGSLWSNIPDGLAFMTARESNAIVPQLFDRLDTAPMIRDEGVMFEVVGDQVLTGARRQFVLVAIFTRDEGPAKTYLAISAGDGFFGMHVGHQGASFELEARPSIPVTLEVRDTNGASCTFRLTIKDGAGRVFPPRKMRIAPDMFFHDHIYRSTGEVVFLPPGDYMATVTRGPEYLEQQIELVVADTPRSLEATLIRWVTPADDSFYSGDMHIHAAGCSHYSAPTEGVSPETMIRHVRGEAIDVGGVLNWGPCYHYQKQFFTGASVSPFAGLEHPSLQEANGVRWEATATDRDAESVLRYDLEVSGFPSSHSGHPVLLGLTDPEYPSTSSPTDWPSWNLPIMQWARSQGAITGYAHCGIGMGVESDELPNWEIPGFATVGLNEALVDVVHGAIDFIGSAQEYPVYELNSWYHILNAGFDLIMMGETDYPCLFDERVGVGRTYVPSVTAPRGDRGAQTYIAGIRDPRTYFGDGRSHFSQIQLNAKQSASGWSIAKGESLRVSAVVRAWIDEDPHSQLASIRHLPPYAGPAWHIERARVGESRNITVELIENGLPVAQTTVLANGQPQAITFDVELSESGWLALRILPSAHTQAFRITVADAPARPIRTSAEWCATAVDRLWAEKGKFIAEHERGEAQSAYTLASDEYRRRAAEGR
jgi:hypothetical protein